MRGGAGIKPSFMVRGERMVGGVGRRARIKPSFMVRGGENRGRGGGRRAGMKPSVTVRGEGE